MENEKASLMRLVNMSYRKNIEQGITNNERWISSTSKFNIPCSLFDIPQRGPLDNKKASHFWKAF